MALLAHTTVATRGFDLAASLMLAGPEAIIYRVQPGELYLERLRVALPTGGIGLFEHEQLALPTTLAADESLTVAAGCGLGGLREPLWLSLIAPHDRTTPRLELGRLVGVAQGTPRYERWPVAANRFDADEMLLEIAGRVAERLARHAAKVDQLVAQAELAGIAPLSWNRFFGPVCARLDAALLRWRGEEHPEAAWRALNDYLLGLAELPQRVAAGDFPGLSQWLRHVDRPLAAPLDSALPWRDRGAAAEQTLDEALEQLDELAWRLGSRQRSVLPELLFRRNRTWRRCAIEFDGHEAIVSQRRRIELAFDPSAAGGPVGLALLWSERKLRTGDVRVRMGTGAFGEDLILSPAPLGYQWIECLSGGQLSLDVSDKLTLLDAGLYREM